jgi:hypothetical protein
LHNVCGQFVTIGILHISFLTMLDFRLLFLYFVIVPDPFFTSRLYLKIISLFFQSADVPEGDTPLTTSGGEEITVTRNHHRITVTSATASGTVIAVDVFATNGVIHVIDTVI